VNTAPPTAARTDDISEDGAILILVLLLMVFVGLGSVPVFDAFSTNRNTVLVVQAGNAGFYASDGAMQYAIQDLRASSTAICGGPTVTVPAALSPLLPNVPLYFSATCTSTASVLTATISSWGGGGGEKKTTVSAVVSINISSRIASVQSWSSVQS
jgi:hypothetical protein